MKRWRSIRATGAGVLCAGLLACGGAGGGDDDAGGSPQPASPSAATADLTASRYAGQADTATQATGASVAAAALFTGDGSIVAAETAGPVRALRFDGKVQRLALHRLLDRQSAQRSGRARALAVTQRQEPCDSGSLLITLDAAESGDTVGDTVQVSSQGCVLDGQPVSGSVLATLTAYSESQSGSSGAATVDYSGFGVPELKFDGRVDAQISDDANAFAVTLRYRGLTVSGLLATPLQWFHTAAYRYGYGSGSESIRFSGYAAVAGGYVELQQLVPFALDEGRPTDGTLQLVGANGARVKVHAGATRFGYEYFAAGNTGSVPDATAPGLAY